MEKESNQKTNTSTKKISESSKPLIIKLKLDGAKPFSINAAYYKKSHTRTAACRDWGNRIIQMLKEPKNQEAMDYFRENYKNGPIRVKLDFRIPRKIFWTVAGEVSLRSMDLSNVEKLLIDLIFDKRFFDRGDVRNICANDKNIVLLESRKSPIEMRRIDVEIEELSGFFECTSCDYVKLYSELDPIESVEVEDGHCPDCQHKAQQ